MTRNIAGAAENAFRLGGAAFNFFLLSAFLYTAVSLYGYGSRLLTEAGGLVSVDAVKAMASEPTLATQWIMGILAEPGLGHRLAGYAAAWFALVGSAGSAWMALLGLRWLYHTLLRGSMTLR